MSSSALPLEIREADNLILFAIGFLAICDRSKKWKKMTGSYVAVCGYTGPGIGLLLQIFIHNGIYSELTLQSFLTRQSSLVRQQITQELFMDIVNETIGNLLDLSPECPATQTNGGIKGILEEEKFKSTQKDEMHDDAEEPPKIYKVTIGGSNLKSGPNIISFTGRIHGCDTFHHAVLYILPAVNTCYIIDSWSNIGECRPLTARRHNLHEVYSIIDELNSDMITPERTFQILSLYFLAHRTIQESIRTNGCITVHTTNPLYIEHIYNKCEDDILNKAQRGTNFGGKTRKRYKNQRTNHGNNRQNKKYRTKKYKSNRKYKIYRRNPITHKKV